MNRDHARQQIQDAINNNESFETLMKHIFRNQGLSETISNWYLELELSKDKSLKETNNPVKLMFADYISPNAIKAELKRANFPITESQEYAFTQSQKLYEQIHQTFDIIKNSELTGKAALKKVSDLHTQEVMNYQNSLEALYTS